MEQQAAEVLMQVKAGVPIGVAVMDVFENKDTYYDKVPKMDRRLIRVAAIEYREKVRIQTQSKAPAMLYVNLPVSLKMAAYRLAHVKQVDINRLIRGLLREAIKESLN